MNFDNISRFPPTEPLVASSLDVAVTSNLIQLPTFCIPSSSGCGFCCLWTARLESARYVDLERLFSASHAERSSSHRGHVIVESPLHDGLCSTLFGASSVLGTMSFDWVFVNWRTPITFRAHCGGCKFDIGVLTFDISTCRELAGSNAQRRPLAT